MQVLQSSLKQIVMLHLKEEREGCLRHPPTGFPTGLRPCFLSSYYAPRVIFWGPRGKCTAMSIVVSKTASSRRQWKHAQEDRTKARLGEMSGIMSITQDGQGHRRAQFPLLDFLEVAGMSYYCWVDETVLLSQNRLYKLWNTCHISMCSEARYKSQLSHHDTEWKHSMTILGSVWAGVTGILGAG